MTNFSGIVTNSYLRTFICEGNASHLGLAPCDVVRSISSLGEFTLKCLVGRGFLFNCSVCGCSKVVSL